MSTPGDIQRLIASTLASRYEILEEIGNGGMAVVFKARSKKHNQIVALKVLNPSLAGENEFLERFHREAEESARLRHRNIIQVYEAGRKGDVHFIAMGYLGAGNLHRFIRRLGRLTSDESARHMAQIAEALGYVHGQGLIHRDVKSSNIIFNEKMDPFLTDFGITHAATKSRLTVKGTVIGTAEFMSPEQASGEEVDGRSDLFSLGIVLYHCLTGKMIFRGSGPMDTIYNVMNVVPVPPSNLCSDIPRWMDIIVQKSLEKRIEARFQSGEEFAEALRSGQSSRNGRRKPRMRRSWSPPAKRSILRNDVLIGLIGVLLVILLFLVWKIVTKM